MRSVRPLVIVECHPAHHACLRLQARFPRAQVNALVLQQPPQTLDEDVVDATAFAVHRDHCGRVLHAVSRGKRRGMAAPVAVNDLRRAEGVAPLPRSKSIRGGRLAVTFRREGTHLSYRWGKPRSSYIHNCLILLIIFAYNKRWRARKDSNL